MTQVEFEIRVAGEIPRDILSSLPEIEVVQQPAGTVLTGSAIDQSAFYGVINRIRGLGLNLIEVRQRPDSGEHPETEELS